MPMAVLAGSFVFAQRALRAADHTYTYTGRLGLLHHTSFTCVAVRDNQLLDRAQFYLRADSQRADADRASFMFMCRAPRRRARGLLAPAPSTSTPARPHTHTLLAPAPARQHAPTPTPSHRKNSAEWTKI